MYCLVENGVVTDGPRELPNGWRRYSGLHLFAPAKLKKLGWLPYRRVRPSHDRLTQDLVGPARAITAAEVVDAWTVRDVAPAEANRRRTEDAKAHRGDEINALWRRADLARAIVQAFDGDRAALNRLKADIAAIDAQYPLPTAG